MFTFPESLLKIAFQYPTTRQHHFVTQVLRFVGGAEQRYGIAGTPLRRWEAKSSVLGNDAYQVLADFFMSVNGTANPFSFVDPWDGTTYPTCFFESDQLIWEAVDEGRNAVSFSVVEGRVQS